MREQIAQQPPYRRRASLSPEERTASWHHAGTRSGMHPEDTPYSSATRSYHPPTPATFVALDEEGEEAYTRPPNRTSARRYDLLPYAGRGERRTEELPRQGKHPMFYIGICLVILVVFLTAYTLIPPAFQKWQDDRMYGYPRTFQTDANVGHGGTEHFLALNNHGTIEVVELPGDPGKLTAQCEEGGRLAYAVRTEEGDHLAPIDSQVDVADDRNAVVADGQAASFEQRRREHSPSPVDIINSHVA